MKLKPAVLLLCLLPLAATRPAAAAKENPKACNCDKINLTEQEQADGCTDQVKRRACPLYRQAQEWRERLRQQQEQREQEKRMQPRNIPRSQ